MLPKNYMKPTQYKKGGKRKKSKGSGKPKPTNPSLWSRAKSMARQKFDVYPSAYANAWAAKWYKSKGGGWRGGSKKKKAEGGFVGFEKLENPLNQQMLNGGTMAQMDPSTQIMNQAIMDNQMLAMGVDPEDPYYNRLYQGGGYRNVIMEHGGPHSNPGDSLAFEQYLKQRAEEQLRNYISPVRTASNYTPDAILEERRAEVSNLKDRGKKISGVEYLMKDEEFRNRIREEYESQKPAVGKKMMRSNRELRELPPNQQYLNALVGAYPAQLAAGGELFAPGGNNDKLTRIDAGGTHEENPLGGVPMGPDASVEEKETIQRGIEPGTDFVFSERLPEGGITPEMAQDEGLPKFVIGKSFAKASKMVEDKSSRSGDILDRNTREVTLARLRDAQEEYKEMEFQNQLSQLEDKFGRPAMPMEQPAGQGMQMPGMVPASEQEAMLQQMQANQGMAPQPSPQEMAMMQQMQQAGMAGQQPSMPMYHGGPHMFNTPADANSLLAGLAQFPSSNPSQEDYSNLARNIYGTNDLNTPGLTDLEFEMQYGNMLNNMPTAEVVADTSSQIDPAAIQQALAAGMNLNPIQGSVVGETIPGMGTEMNLAALAPEVPAIAPTPTPGLQEMPVGDTSTMPTMVQGDNLNYQVGPDGYHYFPNGLIVDPTTGQPVSTGPTYPPLDPITYDFSDGVQGNIDNIVDVPMIDSETIDYNAGNMSIYTDPETGELVVPSGSLSQEEFRGLMETANTKDGKTDLTLEKFNNPYRGQILSDSAAKFLQGIKDIRERKAADYMLHSDYDPMFFPIEEQRKAISNMSAATRKQLSRRVNNPALYLAMAGTINAQESADTAKLFETKFQVEAADNARIRDLMRQDRAANVQMKRLVDELNEKDKQGKEQLLLEAANSFSNAYSGFSKEEFYAFMGDQYLKNADILALNTPNTAGGTGTKKQGK